MDEKGAPNTGDAEGAEAPRRARKHRETKTNSGSLFMEIIFVPSFLGEILILQTDGKSGDERGVRGTPPSAKRKTKQK